MNYQNRKEKIKLPTNRICKHGFVRELKTRLLEPDQIEPDSPQYEKVQGALVDLLIDQNEFPEEGLFSEGTYNKWWNGKGFPNGKNRKILDAAFPGLPDKWFRRERFGNRFQRYLGCLDLPYLHGPSSSCRPGLAFESAETILVGINRDWKPVSSGYLQTMDIHLRGPDKRGGLNVWKNHLYGQSPSGSKPCYPGRGKRIPDERESIDYDLTIGARSFIGLSIPEVLDGIYQENNVLSVIPFLFALLCWELRGASHYRLDLVFDFLSSLICAQIILQEKYWFMCSTTIRDRIERSVFDLLRTASQYFYEEVPFSVEQELKRFDELTRQALKRLPPGSNLEHCLTPPIAYLGSHDVNDFFGIFLGVMENRVDEAELETIFIERNQGLIRDYPHTIANAPPVYVGLLDGLTRARSAFIDQFQVLGWSEAELLGQLHAVLFDPRSV